MSKHCESQHSIEHEYPNVNNHVYDQFCSLQSCSHVKNGCKVLNKNVCNTNSIDMFVDDDKVFHSSEFQHVVSDTVNDLVYNSQSDTEFKAQRHINMPCYSYDDTICHLNYLYDKSDCLGILAFQHFHPYMSDENESAVSQYCKVSFFQCLNEYDHMFSSVIYIHANELKHKWYEYRSGYYGLHSWCPFDSATLGPLTVSYSCQAYLQLFNHCDDDSTLSPHQVYENYRKDLQLSQRYNCSYEQYINHIIDILVDSPGFDSNDISNESSMSNTYSDNASPPKKVDDLDSRVSSPIDESQGDPPAGGVGFGSLGRGDRKCRLVDKYFPDKRTGFIALHQDTFTFIGPDRQEVCIDSIDKCILISRIIRETNEPNYRVARFPLKSGLNLRAWESRLADYPDNRLLNYLTFGFPLSLKGHEGLNNKQVSNHYSALAHPEAVQEYLDKEVSLGAMLGPVSDLRAEEVHCSPLMTRPKDIHKRRVILDLSYPKGASLNDQVDRDRFDHNEFALKLTCIDDIVRDIANAADPVLFKVDVARTFRNLRVDPADCIKLGIKWKDSYYLDGAIAFGWVHGTAAFQLCSDSIAFIMMKEGVNLHCYIDDYVAVAPRCEAEPYFEKLCDLLHELGLPINQDKLTPPTKCLTVLGMEIDIHRNTLSIDPSKLAQIHEECLSVKGKKFLTKKAYQSLLGKLLYIQKCVKPSRIFVNRILALFRTFKGPKIALTQEFHQDLDWFAHFLPHFNGITCLNKAPVDSSQELYLDACLTGMGAVWRNRVYATPIYEIPGFQFAIAHLEMLNLVIALKIWGKFWRHSAITFFCDNMAVVQVVGSGRTRDKFLALCIRNIWLLAAQFDIELEVRHVEGKKNVIADALSRLYSDKPVNYEILQCLTHFIWEEVPLQAFDLDFSI